MATMKIGSSAGSQLDAGSSVLAAARTVDTRAIKTRLAGFERAQRAYSAAHEKVRAAEAKLSAAQRQLGELDVDQDEAVDSVARALVADGHSRANPFAAFGAPAPSKIIGMTVAEEVKAIHQLMTAVQRNKSITKPTLQATQAAEKAAHAVEQALVGIEKLQAAVREARHLRDAVAQTWATAFAALKRGARAAVDEGGAHLYPTLFDRPNRPNGKNGKRTAEATPTQAPSPAPQPAATPAS
jgi:hypothetical protein